MRTTLLKTSLIFLSLSVSGLSSIAHADSTLTTDKIEGCGVITLYEKPPKTKNIHFASINSIDGETITSNSQSYVLPAGKHIIKVIEHIQENSITRRRGEAKNYHIIEFNVEANKKYALGAKFIRKNRSKFSTGEYWQPEVWKTKEAECKL